METHSIGFAVLVGLIVFAWKRESRLALASALAVCTHVLFDWLGSDDAVPFGIMALWPLTSEFYYADAWVFGAISRHYWRDDFIAQNVLAILRELVILLPLVAAAFSLRKNKKRTTKRHVPERAR
jgi:hypothetical protein